MIEAPDLVAALESLPGVAIDQVFTRFVDFEKYQAASAKDLLYDGGPPISGQRYNPIGGPKGLYLGEGLVVARTEFANGTLAALKPKRSSASIQLDAHVRLQRVLDLGNPSIRRKLKTTLDELKSPWEGYFALHGHWPVTWVLGQAIFDSERFDGIRFPSAELKRHYNLLILTERLGPGAEVRVESSDGSPPLAKKTGTFPLKP